MSTDMTVYIVDDDPSVRDALGLLLGIRGYRVALFANGANFLQSWRKEWSGCLLVDIRMPDMDGFTLQSKLQERNSNLPVIIMTGHGDITLARKAFKANAVDFIEKPVDDDKLIEAINEAFNQASTLISHAQRDESRNKNLQSLTAREREVLDLVVQGHHNREIAPMLGISVRTVEVHKSHVMGKLGVDSLAELVRVCSTGREANN